MRVGTCNSISWARPSGLSSRPPTVGAHSGTNISVIRSGLRISDKTWTNPWVIAISTSGKQNGALAACEQVKSLTDLWQQLTRSVSKRDLAGLAGERFHIQPFLKRPKRLWRSVIAPPLTVRFISASLLVTSRPLALSSATASRKHRFISEVRSCRYLGTVWLARVLRLPTCGRQSWVGHKSFNRCRRSVV